MRIRNWAGLFFLPLLVPSFLVLSCLTAAAQARLETVPAPAGISTAVRTAVDAKGAKLVRPDGSVLCEIWLRQSLPAGKAATNAGGYPELSPGTFVGVISFPVGGKDFRGQPVKGTFTMRYQLLPEDGNHLGVAPTRDFVLLLPASADPDPNAQYDYAQMVTLSAQASGTNHPAVFLLLTPEKNGSEPRTYQNADSFQVFAGAMKTEGGKDVAIALVVKGQAEQ